MSTSRSTPRRERRRSPSNSRPTPAGRSEARSSIPTVGPCSAESRSDSLDIFQNPQQIPADSAKFEVHGIPPGRYRLDFIHRGRKLAGSLVLKGDETGDLTVKLQPWGTVVGRVVDEEGKPRTNVELRINSLRDPPDLEFGRIPDRPPWTPRAGSESRGWSRA